VRLNTNNTLELWKEGATPTQLGSDSSALPSGSDPHAIVQVSYDQSAATITLWIDGVQQATGTLDANDDNIDTWVVGWVTTPVTGAIHGDDFACNDQTGSFDTGLPDPEEILYTIHPNAAGDVAEGVRGGTDSGTDHGQVNECGPPSPIAPDDITSYYILDADGDAIAFNLGDVGVILEGLGYEVVHVQPHVRHRAQTFAAMTYRVGLRTQSGGTTVYGSSISHNDITWKTNGDADPRLPGLTQYTDPQGGGAWTGTLLDSTIMEVDATDATPDMWITAMWCYVAFRPVAAGRVRLNPTRMLDASPLGVNSGLVGV
jgi:hypothetical protein